MKKYAIKSLIKTIHFLFLLWVFGRMVPARADTGPWAFLRPDGTQHWYKVISVPEGITWLGARINAVTANGYLVTLTSQEENDFVFGLCDDPLYWNPRVSTGNTLIGPWIGGTQASGAPEPDGQWGWITGESFTYTNWAPGQPNDLIPNENSMYFGEIAGTRLNAWSDTRAMDTNIQAYVIEYDTSPRTAGLLFQGTNVMPGYVLFAPLSATNTYLINNDGMCIHEWSSSYLPGHTVYLVPTGTIFRTAVTSNTIFNRGGQGGRVEKIDWENNLRWAFEYSSTNVCQHHDIALLPNGHILLLAWERHSQSEAIYRSYANGHIWRNDRMGMARLGPSDPGF